MGGTPRPKAHDPRGPASPGGPASPAAPGRSAVDVVRSQERFRLGTEIKVVGRAVLRNYIVTETVTQTFQVRHEEVRLDHEPATDADPAPVSSAASDDRIVEVTLHREVPVVQMEVEATERILLHVDTVTEQVEVSADLREEQFQLDTTR